MKTIVIAALLVNATPVLAETPLAPAGKWTIDYAESGCMLSHDFGAPGSSVSLGIAPLPLGAQGDLLLVMPKAANAHRAKATVTFNPSGTSIDAEIAASRSSKDGRGGARLRLSTEMTDLLPGATSLVVAFPKSTITLSLPPMKAGIDALHACQNDLLKGWGIDPSASDDRADRKAMDLTIVAQRVQPGSRAKDPPPAKVGNDPSGWITSDDYPVEALVGEKQGDVLMLWTIGNDGRVQDCRILQSSGDASLDRASCRAVTMRARYAPVQSEDGAASVTHATGRVAWRIPR